MGSKHFKVLKAFVGERLREGWATKGAEDGATGRL